MKKERLTPVAGQLYTHNRRNAFQSRSYYTVKFTRFTDGRSAWCFLMSNATRILYGGKDKEFPRKSFTCEPFFCFFLIFSFAKLGFSVRNGVMTTGSFAGSNWFTRGFGAFFITGTRMSGMKRIFLSRQSL